MTKWYAGNHGGALDWAWRQVEDKGGRIYMMTVYGGPAGHYTFLADQDSLHLFPGRKWSGYCERAIGWYFGGGCGWMIESPEAQALLESFLVPPMVLEQELSDTQMDRSHPDYW